MNNCPKCGNPLQPGVSTCPICGTMINQAAAPAPGAPVQAPVPPAPAAQPVAPAGVPVQTPVAPMATPGAPAAPVPPAPGAMPAPGGVPTPTAPAAQVPPAPGAPTAPVPPAPGAPAAGTPAALAAQATATAPAAPAKKKGDKKIFIIGGIIAGVILVGLGIFMLVMNKSNQTAAPTTSNNTPAPRIAQTTTVSAGNYEFQRPNGWSNAESAGYVYITKDDESTVIVLNKTSTSLSNATADSLKAAAAGQRLKDAEVTETTVNGKKAFYLSATYNELPVEYYYIDYDTATVIASVVYTKAEYKDANIGEVRSIVDTIVYNEATKAVESYNNYIYNAVMGQTIMFASSNEYSSGSSSTSSNGSSSTNPSGSDSSIYPSNSGSSTTPSSSGSSTTPDSVTPSN